MGEPGEPLAEGPGVIGRYKLLEKIGEGGFGSVYVAEQEEPVRRRVALKVVKLGMDTRQVVARFEAERQALAMMDHPNIAKVHDAGSTESGRPYFVMELVRGTMITEYCAEGSLVTENRPWVAGSWADFDNDGDLDLFVSAFRWTSSHNNALHRNNGDGTFTEVTTGSIARDGSSTGYGSLGAAWGDHWITVQCEGRVSNRSALGTKVRVRATIQGKTYWQMREISNGDARSGNSLDACFGLGDAEIIDRIRIEWPSGIAQEFTNVPADQFLAVTEPGRIALICTIRPDDGAFVLTVTTDPEQSVTIYGSEDLTTWTEVVQSTGGGEVLIVPPTTGVRFFKAQAEP
jgi:hypothetical protein